MVFSLSFALGEYAASKEHGWQSKLLFRPLLLPLLAHSIRSLYGKCQSGSLEIGFRSNPSQMWNGFDTAFIAIFLTYFCLRMKGLLSQDGTLARKSSAEDLRGIS